MVLGGIQKNNQRRTLRDTQDSVSSSKIMFVSLSLRDRLCDERNSMMQFQTFGEVGEGQISPYRTRSFSRHSVCPFVAVYAQHPPFGS